MARWSRFLLHACVAATCDVKLYHYHDRRRILTIDLWSTITRIFQSRNGNDLYNNVLLFCVQFYERVKGMVKVFSIGTRIYIYIRNSSIDLLTYPIQSNSSVKKQIISNGPNGVKLNIFFKNENRVNNIQHAKISYKRKYRFPNIVLNASVV